MFIVTLFQRHKNWKQLRCPSAGEWITCRTARHWHAVQSQKRMDCWIHIKGIVTENRAVVKKRKGEMSAAKGNRELWGVGDRNTLIAVVSRLIELY